MSLPVRIRPEALQEIDEACDWHESARPGLGGALKREIYSQIERIRENPLLYRKVLGSVHCVKIRRFRYQIYYEPFAEHIEIYCVFHTSRNPNAWKKQIRQRR